MKVIESGFKSIETGFEHTLHFEFEGRQFVAYLIETEEERYIRDCYFVHTNLIPIDIPKYFGEFTLDVYNFIYDHIQKGFPS